MSIFAVNIERFDPRFIPGLSCWLDAYDQTTISSSGGTVTSWSDKSGNNNNITIDYGSLTSIKYSIRTNNSFFSVPVDARRTTVPDFNIFIVYNQYSLTNANQGLWGDDVGGGWNRFQVLNFPGINYVISEGSGTYTSIPQLETSNTLVYTSSSSLNNTNASFVNVNGSNVLTYTETAAQTQTSSTRLYFGNIDNSSPYYGLVNFNEILIYQTSLTSNQIQQIESYLINKWIINSVFIDKPHFVENPLQIWSVPIQAGNVSNFPVYPDPIAWFAPRFDPTTVPGLQLWLDGADKRTLSRNGAYVLAWYDKSGNNNSVYLTSGSPTYSDKSVHFNSGAVLQTINYINVTASTTVYVVGLLSGGFSYIIGFTDLNGGDYSIRYLYGLLLGTQAYPGNTDDFANGQYYVNGTFNPNFGSEVYATTHLVDATTTGTHTGSTRITVSSSFLGRYFTGLIKEVLVYSGEPTVEQRQALEIYLADKWGIRGLLPF